MFLWTEDSLRFLLDAADYTRCYDRLADRAAEALSSGTVFEGGCGLGHLAISLARRGFDVTAMDLSPLPLASLRERAWDTALTVRQGDAFSLGPEESYDNGIFCFFGSLEKSLCWAKVHCREKLILFKKNWNTHRFTRDPGGIRRFTFPLTIASLDSLKVPYETEIFEVDMGQPFRSLGEAVRFFQLYDPEATMGEKDILPRLQKTVDPAFPYYLPAIRPVGMIVIRARDIPNIL